MKSKLSSFLFSNPALCRFVCSIMFLMGIVLSAQGQGGTVTANLLITPPYSVYFRDYAGYGRTNNMLLSLFSTTNRRVYLAGSVTKDDNSVVISLKNGYRPVAPILLNGNSTLMLNGLQLRKIYGDGTTDDLNLTGLTANDIALNQALPEGNYTFCIQVKDFDTREIISTACKSIYVTYYDPPQILNPYNGSAVQGFNPQMLMVTWMNTAPQVFGVTYRLKIVKLIKGITPLDAINNNVQLILDKGHLFTTNYPLDIASGVKLEPGQIYCMQVIAESPSAFFKNKGKSEVTTFYYNGQPGFALPKVSVGFLNPLAYKGLDTIEVNNEKQFNLSWHLFEGAQTPGNASEIQLSDTINKKYGLVKYVVQINPTKQATAAKPTDKNFRYSTQITADGKGNIPGHIQYDLENTDKAGLKDSYWYSATVTAYNKDNQVIAENSSVDFQYRKLKDDEVYVNTSVHAVIKYGFKGFSELYNASNTPVEVEALQKVNGASSKPEIKLGSISYTSLAKATATTQANGEVQVVLNIPLKDVSGDSIYYRVLMDGAYYIDKDFKWLSTATPKPEKVTHRDTGFVSFGQLVAKTYGYSLTVNVTKAFKNYRIDNKNGAFNIKLSDIKNGVDYENTDSGMIYKVGLSKAMAGITMALYRKTKKTYIPPVEGNISKTADTKYGDVEVARAITTISSDGKGHDISFVKFDRLLSNIFSGDEYYLIALGGNNNNPSPIQFTAGAAKAGYSYVKPYAKQAFKDNGYVASEASFKLQKPLNINSEDSLYRNVSFNYEITSTKPPTSIVKGRLLYQWKSDKSHLVRPLARSSFKIIVDYLVNGKSIGYTTKFKDKNYEEKFFIPEGNSTYADGMQLLDFGKTMGTGTTDDQGNFEIETINVNPKGSLGKGYLEKRGWTIPPEKQLQAVITGPASVITNKLATVFDPGVTNNGIFGNMATGGSSALQQAVNQTANEQSFLNQGMNVVMDNSGTFLVNSVAKTGVKAANVQNAGIQSGRGPNDAYETKSEVEPDDDMVDFQRVYRIVPDNPYIYPANETAVVQPFGISDAKPFNSLVKEVQVKVFTRSATGTLDEMKVIIFRNLADKTKDLPLGEGNGMYEQKVLIDPQYKDSTGDLNGAARLDKNSIFSTKFEYLWPFAPVNSNGEVIFTTLLAGYGNYYVEAFSSPEIGSKKFYKGTFQSFDTKIDDNDPALWDGSASPGIVNVTVTLQKLESRAFIRLLDQSTQSSIPNGLVRVYNPVGFGVPNSRTVVADMDGYAEIKVSSPPLKDFVPTNGITVKFSGEARGYNPSEKASFTFDLEGAQFIYYFNLIPSGSISGHLVSADEKEGAYIKTVSGSYKVQFANIQKNVEGYIKTASGKVFTTSATGYFTIPAPAIEGNKIEVIPKDVAYFDTSFTVNLATAVNKNVDLKNVSIYRRKHRLHFIINDMDNGAPIDNALVTMGEMSFSTKNGIADFVFENVSVNNYTFIIRGPEGKNYIPITKNVKNEESKEFVTVNISIEKGSEVSGKVMLDGNPVQHARVYVDADAKTQQASGGSKPQGQINNDANLLQAYTDISGNYILHGVPVNNQTIDLLATIDTSFAVSGDRQKVGISNKKGASDFNLKGFKDLILNNLQGFPLTVEKITATGNNDEVKVTGLLHWSESISNFSLNDVNEVIRVEDVLYKKLTTANGKVGVAEADNITLQGTASIKLKYLDKYNVQLSGISDTKDLLTPKPLILTKENDYGVFKGSIQIVDNSFNYPSSYLSFEKENFFFAQKQNGSVSNVLSAVKSAITITDASSGNYRTLTEFVKKVDQVKAGYTQTNGVTGPDYYLSNSSGGNLQFKFIEFNASAEALNSYIDKQGRIHLNISMDCNIKNAKPEKIIVKLNDVVLDENKVYPSSSTTPIEVRLEAWKLSVTNWTISPEQGGIVSNTGLIRTSRLDIPFNRFVLRNDMFLIDSFNVHALQLGGGIVALSEINDHGAAMLFDNKTGSDLSAHWRFTLSGTGGPVATIKGLPGINGNIGINYIQILSNNETVFQLMQTNNVLQVNGNTMTKFSPQVLTNGVDYFNITGGLNIGAPRLGDMSLELNYTGQNGKLAMKLRNVTTDFEGKGFVHFTAVDAVNDQSNIMISNTKIIISGQVEEKPAKSFNPVPAIFTATNGPVPDFRVDLQKDFVMQLTSESNGASTGGYRLTIALGGMYVSNGDWGTLSYEGIMASNSKSDKGVKDTYTKFNVLGDVSVSADKVEMENTTPFGKLTLIFDFPDKRLIGKLQLDHVQLGTNVISGTVETLFDPAGFYVAGGGSAEINIGNPIADGTYNLGFMIGSYPLHSANEELWKVVTAYKQPEVKNDCFVQKLNGKLAGFYMSVDRMIFDVDYDWDFVIVSGYVNGKALVGVDMWANFSGQTSLGVAVKVYAHAAAGMSAMTGTSISGDITALAALKLAYEYNKFVVQGSIDMSFGVTIRQSLIATSVSTGAHVGCSAQGGTEGFSFKITPGDPITACY